MSASTFNDRSKTSTENAVAVLDTNQQPPLRIAQVTAETILEETSKANGQHVAALSHARTADPRVTVVVVIPAYNEEKRIANTIEKVREFVTDIIVVDDGSADNTAEIAREHGVTVIQHEQNQGKGVALTTGFRKAQELFNPDVVVTLDADGQHIPKQMPFVMAPVLRGEADIVVGSRYLSENPPDGPSSNVPLHRIYGHWFFNLLTNKTSGVDLTDTQSGFRAFSSRALEFLNFESNSFGVECEMQFIARDYDLKTTEVPITILYNDKPKRSVIKHGFIVLNGLFRLIGQYRPLLFFGMTGLVILLFGLLLGTTGTALMWLEIISRTNQGMAIGTALATTLVFFVGSALFFKGFILHSMRGMILKQSKEHLTGLDKIVHPLGQQHPLLFCGISGLLILGTGVIGAIVGASTGYSLTNIPAMDMATLVLFFIFGGLLLFTGVILHSVRGIFIMQQRKADRVVSKVVHKAPRTYGLDGLIGELFTNLETAKGEVAGGASRADSVPIRKYTPHTPGARWNNLEASSSSAMCYSPDTHPKNVLE